MSSQPSATMAALLKKKKGTQTVSEDMETQAEQQVSEVKAEVETQKEEVPQMGIELPTDTPLSVSLGLMQEDGSLVSNPASKLKKILGPLTVSQLEDLYIDLPVSFDGWHSMSKPQKKAVILKAFTTGPGKQETTVVPETGEVETSDGATALQTPVGDSEIEQAAPTPVVAPVVDSNDKLVKMVATIENITDAKTAIDYAVQFADTVELNYFKLGGMLCKIQENMWFGEYEKFDQFIEAKFRIGYRRAMYFMALYKKLVSLGLSWADVEGVGWSKLRVLHQILTIENVKEWLEKAKSLPVRALEEAVRQALADEAPDAPEGQEAASETTTMSFKLHKDQRVTVEAALDLAASMSGSSVASVNLEYIALQFAAAPPAGGKSHVGAKDPQSLIKAMGGIEEACKKFAAAVREAAGSAEASTMAFLGGFIEANPDVELGPVKVPEATQPPEEVNHDDSI